MSHQEKQRIFDLYARSQRYLDWDQLHRVYSVQQDELLDHIFAAFDLVQEEQQKRIAEDACIEPKGMMTRVDKSSIINPENLIK